MLSSNAAPSSLSRLRSRLLLYLGAWRQSEAHKRSLHYEVTTTSATGRDHGTRLGREDEERRGCEAVSPDVLVARHRHRLQTPRETSLGWMDENVERLGRLSAMRRRLSRSNAPNHANLLRHGNLVRRSFYLSLGRWAFLYLQR